MIAHEAASSGQQTIKFMDRFKGKVNKVGRLGVNALLLKGTPENV